MPIFSCLVGVIDLDHETVDEDILDDHLREAEEYILTETTYSDRRAYNACPETTRSEIYTLLQQVGAELAKKPDQRSDHPQLSRQRAYEMSLDIFNAASIVFAFYFPTGVNVPTVPKFWGAIQTIICAGLPIIPNAENLTKVPRPSISSYNLLSMRSELRSLCVTIQAFNEIFARSSRQEQTNISVPKEVMGSWMHLLMGLIHLSKDVDRSDQLVEDAVALFHSSMATVVRSLSETKLLESFVVLPLELLSLLGLKLLQDTTVGMPNINKCYFKSLKKMIDTTKDRHNNAIYAFTIVTIIFLPLSSVASIFGMNTNDVRNMELNQWAYWATAIPVTAVVIFFGLLWTGELGNIVHWIQSFGKRQQGYETLPDSLCEDEDYYTLMRTPLPPPPSPYVDRIRPQASCYR